MRVMSAAVLTLGLAFPAGPAGAVSGSSAATNRAALVLTPVEPIEYPGPEGLSAAGRMRLQAERLVFVKELLSLRKWVHEVVPKHVPDMDDAAMKPIVERVNRAPLETPADNRTRFAEGMAARVPLFGQGYAHYREGRHADAIAAFEPLMAERPGIKQRYRHNTLPPYCYGITKFLYAECLGRVGNTSGAVIGYQVVHDMLSENLTLGAAAYYRAAHIYETTGRIHAAGLRYQLMARRQADSLSDDELLRLHGKIAGLMAADPYRIALRSSADVLARLRREEAGSDIRDVQQRLAPLLAAMLAMPEEEPRPFLESTHTLAPIVEVKSAKLEDGSAPEDFSGLGTPDPAMATGDDWGRLRPRERQKLLQWFAETYPARYRDMLESYYRNISRAESEAERGAK